MTEYLKLNRLLDIIAAKEGNFQLDLQNVSTLIDATHARNAINDDEWRLLSTRVRKMAGIDEQ